MEDIEERWKIARGKIGEKFGEEIDLQGILFLIGVQELGKGKKKFTKNQKLDLLHIALCRLLSREGFYEFDFIDQDGWPHWKPTAMLPFLKPGEQLRLVKKQIILYFEEQGVI